MNIDSHKMANNEDTSSKEENVTHTTFHRMRASSSITDFEWIAKTPAIVKQVLAGANRREPVIIEEGCKLKKEHYFLPEHYDDTIDYIMITHGQIVDRVEKLAWDIFSDYNGETIHFLCVLKGN